MNTQEVTFTKEELLNYQQGIGFMLDVEELDIRTRYWLGKKLKPLLDEAQSLQKLRAQEQQKIQILQQKLQQKMPLNGTPDNRVKEFEEAQQEFEEKWQELMAETLTIEVPVILLDDLEKCEGVLERNQQGQAVKRGKPTVRILMQLDWMIAEPS